jgi:hypothetical protein
MTAQTPYTGRELSKIALQVATEASRLVLEGFRRQQTVSIKSDQSPVTEFDLQSERLIRERLAELTPHIPVVGEEQGGQAAGEYTWYCDPIDGTINFMRGHPFFAVSLGVARCTLCWCRRGAGAPALVAWQRGRSRVPLRSALHGQHHGRSRARRRDQRLARTRPRGARIRAGSAAPAIAVRA